MAEVPRPQGEERLIEKSIWRSCHLRCPHLPGPKGISTVSQIYSVSEWAGSLEELGCVEPRSMTLSLPPWPRVLSLCLGTPEAGTPVEWHS